jgi:4-hydroxybenzoate polyprenyltransferase
MILLFVAVNGLFVSNITGFSWSWSRFGLVFLLILSFFFRMRLFDEIKDYEVDLKINPTRPLARGILTVSQVKVALILLIIFELSLSAYLGWSAFTIHAIAIGYSLLMYEEFFIGDFLRPHLTTYAVTHTFSSFLLAISSGIAMTGPVITVMPRAAFIWLLMNWAFFNLFEFARKTFAPVEERKNVPSYSNIFGRRGAWALSVSQAIIGVALVCNLKINWFVIAACAIYIGTTVPYLLKDTAKAAKLFRNSSAAYLLIHYIILLIVIWWN